MKRLAVVTLAAATTCCAAVACIKWDDWFVKPGLRASLEASLKDPFSVEYRNDEVQPGGGILCGEYNAKNAYGAYSGFQRFVTDGKRYAVDGGSLSTWDDSTPFIIRQLEIGKSVVYEITREVQAGAPMPTPDEIRIRSARAAFQALWDEYCRATAST